MNMMTAIAASRQPSFGRTAWDQAVAAFRSADAADRAYSPTSDAAADRWSAVRNQWPMHYNFDRDPGARAQLDAASAVYDPVEKRSEELTMERHYAGVAMVTTPAPDVAALRDKMAWVIQEEAWDLTRAEELFAAVMADLERLAAVPANRRA